MKTFDNLRAAASTLHIDKSSLLTVFAAVMVFLQFSMLLFAIARSADTWPVFFGRGRVTNPFRAVLAQGLHRRTGMENLESSEDQGRLMTMHSSDLR